MFNSICVQTFPRTLHAYIMVQNFWMLSRFKHPIWIPDHAVLPSQSIAQFHKTALNKRFTTSNAFINLRESVDDIDLSINNSRYNLLHLEFCAILAYKLISMKKIEFIRFWFSHNINFSQLLSICLWSNAPCQQRVWQTLFERRTCYQCGVRSS